MLVRVGQIELTALKKLRRTRRQLKSPYPRALNSQRKEDARITERVVIEEVLRSGMEVAAVDVPTLDRKGRAELIFFIALAVQWHESDPLSQRELEQRTRNR